jgi:cell division protein FtsI (penicillin-binding protein 3)
MKDRRRTYFKARVLLVFITFGLCFGVIVVRTYKLQVVKCTQALTVAERQYFAKRILLTPRRGTIYDALGRELAVSVPVESVYAQPPLIADKKGAARKLSNLLDRSRQELYRLLSSDKNFVWLKRKITPSLHQSIAGLQLDGIGFVPECRRFYPNSESAAHTIGFAGMDSQGLEGLEKVYDEHLKTNKTATVLERDALGRWIYLPADEHTPKETHNLHLTIDHRIQHVVERELDRGVEESKARAGTAIVMEPKTGKVLAMAVHPPFNPNLFNQYQPSAWRNRAVTDPFEPGSLMKVFLLAAALEESITKEHDIFFCENGSYRIGGITIHDIKPHAWLSLRNIVRLSSNIGASKVGELVGAETYHHYLTRFGFGSLSGIDLLGEAKGIVRPASRWRKADMATSAFGQGLSVTPLQLVTALSAIANGGKLLIPYLVEYISDGKGEVVKEFFPRVRRKVLSEKTCGQVTSILTDVVHREGTGALARVPGYQVAGKTGTAQKADLVNGGYSTDKIVISFMGFLPAGQPRIALLVTLDEPVPSTYGGLSAAPVFQRIAADVIHYLGVPPREHPSNPPHLLHVRDSANTGVQPRLACAASGMPDVRGLCMRAALTRLQEKKAHIRIVGTGHVVEQKPQPGARLLDGGNVLLECAPIVQ